MWLLTSSLLLLMGMVAGDAPHTCSTPTCSTSAKLALLPANQTSNDYIYIGGIFGIHEAGSSQYECGTIRESGIQNLEAFFWAVRTFQDRYPGKLQGVDIGAFAFDSCSSSDRALQQVLNLENCVVGYGNPAIPPARVLGFVGADQSSEAMALAPVLGEMDKVLISHAATSDELNSAQQHPYFLRTVPSDAEQGLAIAAVLAKQEWKYVQAVYSSDAYGTTILESFKDAAADQEICIVNSVVIPDSATDSDRDDIIINLMERPETRVVVVFADSDKVKLLLQAARRQGNRRAFTWVGTNSWATDPNIVDGVEEYAEGAVTLALDKNQDFVDDFEDDYEDLTPSTFSYNPWLTEYWEEHFQCYFPGSTNINSPTACNTNIQSLDGSAVNPYVPYAIMAVDAMLAGISDARDNACSQSQGLCSAFLETDETKWALIHDKILSVDIPDVGFDRDTGNSIGVKHMIYNYRSPVQFTCDEHCYEHIGSFQNTQTDPEMYGLVYSYYANGTRDENPSTVCAANPCQECGEVTPRPTTATTVAGGDGGTTSGAAPGSGDPPVEMRDGNWVIVLIILAGLGILFVVVFEIYLMTKMLDTPFVTRFRTMWLGQLLLFAIFLSFLTLFAFVPSPTDATCGILRFGIGCSYAMCFSVLLVKLMIIHSSETIGYLKGIYQILMFIFAWGVQIAIDAEWLILREPQAIYDSDEERWVCKQDFDNHVTSLAYVMFLILICTIMSVKTHGISTNHREGTFIGMSAGFAIPIWLAWILLGSFNSNSEYEDPCLAFGLLATVTLILFIMFLPKVRQLNNIGLEGIYAEDDQPTPEYPSIMAPSIRPAESMMPPGSVIANNVAYLSDHNIGYAPSVVPSQKLDIVDHDGGSLMHVEGVGEVYEAATIPRNSHLHYESDPSALYIRHPGAPSHDTLRSGASVHSVPIAYVQRAPSQTGTASSRVLRVTNDLTGRTPMDERIVLSSDDQLIYATNRSGRSVSQGSNPPSLYSLQKTHSIHDLGSL